MAMLLQISCSEDTTTTANHFTGWDEDYEYTPEEEEEEEEIPEEENPDYTYPASVTITTTETTTTDEETGMRMISILAFTSAQLDYEYTVDTEEEEDTNNDDNDGDDNNDESLALAAITRSDSQATIDIDKWTWSSSDNTILNIDTYGKITGFSEGVAMVKISYSGSEQRVVVDSMLVDVYFIRAQSIDITNKDSRSTVYEGYDIQLSAAISPSNISFPDAPLEWSVSNELVATVDENGLVYAYSADEKAAIKVEKESAGESVEGIDDTEIKVYAKPTDGADTELVYGEFDLTIIPVDEDAGVIITSTTSKYCLSTTPGFQVEYSLVDGTSDTSVVSWSSNNTSVATVNDSGYVTLTGGYGEVTISAKHDNAPDAQTYDFTVPAGWWIEEYNTTTGTYKVAGSTTTYDEVYFLSNGNSSTIGSGYMDVTVSNNTTYTATPIINGYQYTLGECFRADLWCVNEAKCVLNANTYPYLVVHIDDVVANKDAILYEMIALYPTSTSSAGYYFAAYSNLDYYNTVLTTRYFDDGSLMWIFDLSKTGHSAYNGDLTSAADSYYTSGNISLNMFMYGHLTETTAADGITYPALASGEEFKVYSVQTFATAADINEYISDKSLTEIIDGD